jgi:hypothetical protein
MSGTRIRYVTQTFAIQTTALDTGDVIASTQVIANACPAADVPVELVSMVFIDVDDQKAIASVVFFDDDTVLGTEDSAPDIDDTEALTVQGVIAMAVADYVDLGGASVVTKTNIGLILKPKSGMRDVYAALYTPATSTPTYAGGAITVRYGFRKVE